jgi:putative transposase
VHDWVQGFGPRLAHAVRRQRHPVGKRWFVDEVFLFRKGQKLYLYRAIDEDGVVVDILLRDHGWRQLNPVHANTPLAER